MNRPKFSVIIPTYNRGRVLLQAVRSVLEQSCPDFELLIVDDGSTDNTGEIVAGLKDKRIRFFRQENGGASRARNTGMRAAGGEYIAFLDADDRFLPGHLARALPVLASGRGICTYSQVIVNRGGVSFLKPPRSIDPGEHIADYLLGDRGFVPTITLIIPAELAREVRYDENTGFGDDIDFAVRLARAGARLHMLPEPGAVWNDLHEPERLSARQYPEEQEAWLARMERMLTRRAYLAGLGWHVARSHARQGRRARALKFYLRALAGRCYRPRIALVVFLQIILPADRYRKLADTLARLGFSP